MRRWQRVGFMMSSFLTVLTLAIFLTINSFWLYRLDISWLDISQLTHLSPQRLMLNYHQMLGYLELPWVTSLHMSNFPSSFTGAQHFADVKQLFALNNGILVISVGPSLWFWHELQVTQQAWRLVRPIQAIMVVPVVVAGVMAVNFDAFFVDFHELLFRNNDWLFDPALDPVINALPDQFFLHCFILFFSLLELFLALGLWWGRHQFQQKSTRW